MTFSKQFFAKSTNIYHKGNICEMFVAQCFLCILKYIYSLLSNEKHTRNEYSQSAPYIRGQYEKNKMIDYKNVRSTTLFDIFNKKVS